MSNSPLPESGDRRPISARQWGSSQRFARWLTRQNISPNTISVFGMICGIGSGIALASTPHFPQIQKILWLFAALLIVLRLLANMFDGMVAVEGGKASPVGELFNEIPDRISDSATLIGLGYAVGGHIELGYGAALAAVFVAYIRTVGKACTGIADFGGPFAKQQRMAIVIVVAILSAILPNIERIDFWPQGGLSANALLLILLGSLLTAWLRLRRIAKRMRKPR
jgi:phosphatidylglycerophosphate synthase